MADRRPILIKERRGHKSSLVVDGDREGAWVRAKQQWLTRADDFDQLERASPRRSGAPPWRKRQAVQPRCRRQRRRDSGRSTSSRTLPLCVASRELISPARPACLRRHRPGTQVVRGLSWRPQFPDFSAASALALTFATSNTRGSPQSGDALLPPTASPRIVVHEPPGCRKVSPPLPPDSPAVSY